MGESVRKTSTDSPKGKKNPLKLSHVKAHYLHVKVRSSKYYCAILNILVIAKAKALIWEEGHSA